MGAGFPIIEADSAEEALRALSGGRNIAAVVTDIRMPGSMDGIGLCRWMREHTPDTPIIAMTGFAELEEAKKGQSRRDRGCRQALSARGAGGAGRKTFARILP